MIQKIVRDRIYCGLDIGSQLMKVCAIKARNLDNVEVIGVHETTTRGYHESSVTDIHELTDCVNETINTLKKQAGIRVKEVVLGVSGGVVSSRYSHAVMSLVDKGTKIISSRDVQKVNEQSRLLGLKLEEHLLHDFSQIYRVDDINLAANPVGMYGRKMDGRLLLILADSVRVNNITKAVNQAGFEVPHVFFSSLVSSEAMLSDKSKKRGCILVNVGAQTSDILMFKDDRVKFLEIIRGGGGHITKSISQHLKLPMELAEEIKKTYAVASGTEDNRKEEILVKSEEGYLSINRESIFNAIEPEVTRSVDEITRAIINSQLIDQMEEGILMIGGGCLLPGLLERIESLTNLSVHIGKVNGGHTSTQHAAIFAPAIGLAVTGFGKSMRYCLTANGRKDWAGCFRSRLKELYQEYF